MKAIKKYAYLSPETEILSLETKCILWENSVRHDEDPGNNQGGYHAPWRY